MSFTQQTGYRRSGPVAICQDHEALLAVREFTFDLNDPDFVSYFESRTGVCISWSPACGYDGSDNPPYLATEKEWKTICRDIIRGTDMPARILRGKLEDCWELYRAEYSEGSRVERGKFRHGFVAKLFHCAENPAAAKARALADYWEPTNLVFAEFDRDEYIVTASPYAV
jgi:hypothetical protein